VNLKQAKADLRVEEMQRLIDLENMTKQLQELVAESVAAATIDARTQLSDVMRDCKRVNDKQLFAKSSKIKELERAVLVAEGKLLVLEASVERLLDDQAGELEELHKETEEAMTARHAEAIQMSREADALMRRQHAAELKAVQGEKVAAEAAKARAEFAAARKLGEAAAEVAAAVVRVEKALYKLSSRKQLDRLLPLSLKIFVSTCLRNATGVYQNIVRRYLHLRSFKKLKMKYPT
jgi:vacuolar-type H+-ATPase subunit I/STV1